MTQRPSDSPTRSSEGIPISSESPTRPPSALRRSNSVSLGIEIPARSESSPSATSARSFGFILHDDDGTLVYDTAHTPAPRPPPQSRVDSPEPLTAPFLARSASDIFGLATSAVRSGYAAVSPELFSSGGVRPQSAMSGPRSRYFSFLDMSPLSTTATSSRRLELLDDVGPDLPAPARLSVILQRFAEPLSVAYSAADELTDLAAAAGERHLPPEVYHWVRGIVKQREIYESIDEVSRCLAILDSNSTDLYQDQLNCLAIINSAVADQSWASKLPSLEHAIRDICGLLSSDSSSASSTLPSQPSVVSTRSLTSGQPVSLLTPDCSSAAPTGNLQHIVWESNPALSVMVTLELNAPSPFTADAAESATAPRFTSVLHLYPRSAADFENLRAIWFVHSRDYLKKIRAQLVLKNMIFSWFVWNEQFPEPSPDGETVLFRSMNSETNIFYQSEFFFPEILAQEFLFEADAALVARQFLMYPHKVYFGTGPKLRCLLDTLGDNLHFFVRKYLSRSLGYEDSSSWLVTRSQLEAGAFMDTVYNTPLMILGSRMPAKDFDPEPIVRLPGSGGSELYPDLSWMDMKVLWHKLGYLWSSHSDSQYGINCLLLQLNMVATKIDDNLTFLERGMEQAPRDSFHDCRSKYKSVDITILPMFMYFVTSRPENMVFYSIPIRFADLLGHLENRKIVDRAARLKAAFVVANDQFTMISVEKGPLIQVPSPSWYNDHLERRPRLADIFQDYYSPPSTGMDYKLLQMIGIKVGAEGSLAEWYSFKNTSTYTEGASSSNIAVRVCIETLTWFYESFLPANPDVVTNVFVFEFFDADFMSLLLSPVNRTTLAAWQNFKEFSHMYTRRPELSPEMKSIINVVEWYFDAYADGYWLDYHYPWFFITNIYGQKFTERADRESLLADVSGILTDVINVQVESLKLKFDDPDLFDVGPEVDVLVAGCLGDADYIPPAPMLTVRGDESYYLRMVLKSIIFAQKVFKGIKARLERVALGGAGSPTPPSPVGR